MSALFAHHSPYRIFGFSAAATVGILAWVFFGLGIGALAITLILVVVELTFSFDNAIVNAKVLGRMSPAWQTAFLTIGIVIAIFGMRLLFPLVIVALAAHLPLTGVWDLALHHPHQYAEKLELAHPLISAFGGAFMLMLTLEFFLNGQHDVLWWETVEINLRKFRSVWLPAAIAAAVVVGAALLAQEHTGQVLRAGFLGIVTFVAVQLFTAVLSRNQPHGKHLVGWAAFGLFLYLQVLDASFSFDGVIGAFAITNVVLLIAAGLGIGALWVRSLTIFMVRRGTLDQYVYLEHGAYYTIAVLTVALFLSLFLDVPDAITGLVGIGIIGAAFAASLQERRHKLAGSSKRIL
ncbi:MAG TPA: DUF475 domain-containing protein [Candidatus Saccharimonadales bacterium]|nr:DUF475 domain-containing protein [Candidatus Saccharimonadales bacterium]